MTNQTTSNPILAIDASIPLSKYVSIDLSVDNQELEKIDITSAKDMELYINKYILSRNAKVAIGGYLEKRNIYKRSRYFNQIEDEENERNIHLGVDIWAPEETNVLAALEGEIHSFKNNTNHGDYGPCIILKHTFKEYCFHTLYGHLSLNSLSNIKVGQKVKQGEVIAQLGDSSVNGDYAPHLHFQIIKDLQNNFGDYPGVCSSNQLDFYKENCPNPIFLLGLQHVN